MSGLTAPAKGSSSQAMALVRGTEQFNQSIKKRQSYSKGSSFLGLSREIFRAGALMLPVVVVP